MDCEDNFLCDGVSQLSCSLIPGVATCSGGVVTGCDEGFDLVESECSKTVPVDKGVNGSGLSLMEIIAIALGSLAFLLLLILIIVLSCNSKKKKKALS